MVTRMERAPEKTANGKSGTGRQNREAAVWRLLETVPDPEIPVLTVVDLGVVRAVRVDETVSPAVVHVDMTPTYSGCPAIDAMGMSVRAVLEAAGFAVRLKQVLSPPWTTDWLTQEARRKLKAYGIAPPAGASADKARLSGAPRPACPQCGSHHTELISEFGSTACKSLHRCRNCAEPFDHFKCH